MNKDQNDPKGAHIVWFHDKNLSGVHLNIYEPQSEKTCLQEFANNTGADQPAHHPLSQISAFVIPLLESII